MSKQAFAQARQLIREKRYHEARSILERIDHPKATEWILKLDSLTPRRWRPRITKRTVILFVVFILFLGGLIASFVIANQQFNEELEAIGATETAFFSP